MSVPEPRAERAAQVAKLARLKLTDAELSEVETYLDQMLGAFQSLQKVDTNGVAPLMNPSEGGSEFQSKMPANRRSDQPRLFNAKSVLECSENREDDDFTVVAE